MDTLTLVNALIRILLAVLCGGIIGAERLLSGKTAGIRTHIVVCVGSALTAMIGVYAYEDLGFAIDPLRISAQVMSGIGFLGVGTILVKGHAEIKGLTTAAGLWTTSAIGIGLGIGYYAVSFVVAFTMFFTAIVVNRLEEFLTARMRSYDLYLEIDGIDYFDEVLKQLSKDYSYKKPVVTGPRSHIDGNVGIELEVNTKERIELAQLKENIKKYSHIKLVLDSI